MLLQLLALDQVLSRAREVREDEGEYYTDDDELVEPEVCARL